MPLNSLKPCVTLINARKQFGIEETILVRVECLHNSIRVPVSSANALDIDGQYIRLRLKIGNNYIFLTVYLWDAVLRRTIMDKRALFFDDSNDKIIAESGCVLFKIYTIFKTRDWENKISGKKVRIFFNFSDVFSSANKINKRYLDH